VAQFVEASFELADLRRFRIDVGAETFGIERIERHARGTDETFQLSDLRGIDVAAVRMPTVEDDSRELRARIDRDADERRVGSFRNVLAAPWKLGESDGTLPRP